MVPLVVIQEYIKDFFGKYQLNLLNMQENSRNIIFNLVLVEGLQERLERSSCYTKVKNKREQALLGYVKTII